jgi:hypothetical protein
MTTVNTYLNSLAEGETFTAYVAVTASTDFDSFDTTATDIGTELGSRITATASRINNVVTWTGIRSGASVVDTVNGDVLTGAGLFTASTGGDLMFTIPLASLTQTTSFDIEFNFETTYDRR